MIRLARVAQRSPQAPSRGITNCRASGLLEQNVGPKPPTVRFEMEAVLAGARSTWSLSRLDEMDESEFEAELQRSIEPYRISPSSEPFPIGSVIRSLGDAVDHLQKTLNMEIEFHDDEVVESESWWYIPFVWMGCAGYIIDKRDGYINQLGSCHPLDLCFWAHERNIKYSYSDLVVSKITNLTETIATLKRLGNSAPINPIRNKSDDSGNRNRFLTDSDIEKHLASLPAVFENQFLWFTIPALKKSEDAGDFEFAITRGSWDCATTDRIA